MPKNGANGGVSSLAESDMMSSCREISDSDRRAVQCERQGADGAL